MLAPITALLVILIMQIMEKEIKDLIYEKSHHLIIDLTNECCRKQIALLQRPRILITAEELHLYRRARSLGLYNFKKKLRL